MATACEKKRCEKEAVNKLRFTDYVQKDLDTEYPVALCEEHTKEAQEFEETDVAGIRTWLNT